MARALSFSTLATDAAATSLLLKYYQEQDEHDLAGIEVLWYHGQEVSSSPTPSLIILPKPLKVQEEEVECVVCVWCGVNEGRVPFVVPLRWRGLVGRTFTRK